MLNYAEVADLAAAPWSIDPAPPKAAAQLLSASSMVTKAVRSSLYDVDTDGYPSDTAVRAGFRDATCAQVSAWVAAGIDPTAAAAAQSTVVASKSLGPRSVQYATYERDAAQRQYLSTHLCDLAVQILAELGLCDGVRVTG